jgi:PAS domain S-box-containing protein
MIRRPQLAVLVLLAGCWIGNAPVPLAADTAKKVFVLESFNRGYVWTDNMLRGIDDGFAAAGFTIESYVFYMDLKRVAPSPEYFARLRDLISLGYGHIKFDAVMACDNDALDFLRRYRDELFPGLPLVFVSVNDWDPAMLDGRTDLTGTSENTDYAGTIELALRLRPDTRTLVVVSDGTTTGKAHFSAVEKVRPVFASRLEFRYLSLADFTHAELAAELAALAPRSAVLLLHHFMDKDGVSVPVAESAAALARACPAPIFVLTDIRIGLGAVGGHVVSGYVHGRTAADMAVRILGGEPVAAIPVLLDSPNQYQFDYRALRRFGIPLSALPSGSLVLDRPDSFIGRYWPQVAAIAAAFALLLGLLVLIQRESLQRRKLALQLRDKNDQLQSILDTAMDGFCRCDRSGRLIEANAAYCGMSGYAMDELLKLTISDLDACDSPEAVAGRIERIAAGGATRFESRHRRRDGSLYDVEVSIQYQAFAGGQLISFLRDVTERKRAEETLKRNLAEKEVLLREVHHRVKNNLNIVAGLLDMQADSLSGNPAAVAAFARAGGRIQAMALVQEELYKSRDYARVALDRYLGELAGQLLRAFGSDQAVKLTIQAEPIQIEVNAAIPCGLILNELITNAFKHAFPDGRRGEIRVGLARLADGRIELSVADDGVGLPAGYDDAGRGSIGQTLIRLLCDQLEAELSVASERGARFGIVFTSGGRS